MAFFVLDGRSKSSLLSENQNHVNKLSDQRDANANSSYKSASHDSSTTLCQKRKLSFTEASSNSFTTSQLDKEERSYVDNNQGNYLLVTVDLIHYQHFMFSTDLKIKQASFMRWFIYLERFNRLYPIFNYWLICMKSSQD